MEETQVQESKKSGSTMWVVIGLVVLVVVGGGLFLAKKMNKPASAPIAMQAVSPTQSHMKVSMAPSVAAEVSGAMDAVNEITVNGGSFYFKPNEIHVKKGQKVKITLKNDGGLHDFVIDELHVKSDRIKSGESTIIEFTPDKTGTFEYYCSVGNHRQMGMKGNLIVE
jgi:plastocyanin